MASGEGMVAVVRGLQDAGLAVTLLDAGRQYTLVPDSVVTQAGTPRANQSRHSASQYAADTDAPTRRESAVQATDGRYASTYRMAHCRLTPTSPPELVTEFPPQRAELYPGHENFVIGGAGSGESYSQATKCNSFRGGMCWPDRGSVYTPKPSKPTDTFTSSLRKYPNVTQDRSSEIVERLISFTQAKHSTLRNQRSSVSPTRIIGSDVSNQTVHLDNSSRNITNAKYPCHYEPEVVIRSKRLDESPTRDRLRRGAIDQEVLESWRRSTFCRTNDVRYLRDVSRKVRDGLRNLTHQPNIQPEKLNKIRASEPNVFDKRVGIQPNTNTVNMEIQAAVPMISREVVTVPLAVPSQRTIAVPLTPTPSRTETNIAHITEIQQPEIPTTKNGKELQAAISTVDLSDNQLKQYGGSKSQDAIRMLQNEILVFKDLYVKPCYSKLHPRFRSRTNKYPIKFTGNFERVSKHDSEFNESRCHRSTNDSNDDNSIQPHAHIARTEPTPYMSFSKEDLSKILKDWLELIPIERGISFDAKELLFYQLFECLKYFVSNPFETNRQQRLKSYILDRLDHLPIEIKENTRIVFSKLADILINKMKHFRCKKCSISANNSKREIKELKGSSPLVGNVVPTEGELKIFTSAELILYLEKTHLKINRHKINDLRDDLVDCFMFFMQEMNFGNYTRVKKSVINISEDYGFSEHQATHFANLLIKHLKESFINNITPTTVRSETYIVLQNIQNFKRSRKSTINNSQVGKNYKHKNNTDISYPDDYTTELCKQINEWLSSLNCQILDSIDNGLRQVIINDLAGDILDRQKYLELNPKSKENSDEAELEHLRYQIFKWVSKPVGEDNFVLTNQAPELMKRIERLAHFRERIQPLVNIKSRCDDNIKINISSHTIKHGCNTNVQSTVKQLDSRVSNSSRQLNVIIMSQEGTNKIAFRDSANNVRCNDLTKPSQEANTVEHLKAEYRLFIKDWVQRVPIKGFSPEHEELIERARINLENSLWKIVSKLNCDPATYYNRFFYEDLLGDAIEDLLDALPQTEDLRSMRHLLKEEFIEKSVNINDQIKAREDASFKNKLVKNVIKNLRIHGIIDNEHDESIRQDEDLQIKKLVEEYLLYTRFKNDNHLIADVFKNKMIQEIEHFVEDLKKNHAKELNNIDASSYKAEIMNTLQKVPLPSERIIKEEADDALLEIEVEDWYLSLPIIPNEDFIYSHQNKRELEILTLKIKEIENNISANDSYTALKDEILKFLETTPLSDSESTNIDFLADELLNRIRNMKKQYTSQTTKKVVFRDPDSYEDFGKNVPFASSYIEGSENITTQNNSACDKSTINHQPSTSNKLCCADLNSKRHVDQKVTPSFVNEPSNYQSFSEENRTSSSYHEPTYQWHTLQDSQANIPGQNLPKSAQHYYFPNTSYAPQEYKRDAALHGRENKLTDQHHYPNSNDQRYVLERNQKEAAFADNIPRDNAYGERSPSIQFNPGGIRTSRGILGISQDAGPSGYSPGFLENYESSLHPSQIPLSLTNTGDNRGDVTNQSIENITYQQTPGQKVNQSLNENSIGCQSLGRDGVGKLENDGNAINTNHIGVSTRTSTGHISERGQTRFTPRQDPSPSTLRNVNKRRPKLLISEREGVKRRISRNDTDEEDYHCRCIERFWKCRWRPKCFASEDIDDFPPCLPLFIPYPCFFYNLQQKDG